MKLTCGGVFGFGQIICPACGSADNVWKYSGSEGEEYICQGCGKTLIVESGSMDKKFKQNKLFN